MKAEVVITPQREIVPPRVRIDAPAEMRDGVSIHVVRMRLVVFEPVVHQLGIETAFDLADEAIAHLQPDFILNIPAIGQDNDVAGLNDHGAVGVPSLGKVWTMPPPQRS